MSKRRTVWLIEQARKAVAREIASLAQGDSMYAGGLASEGYAGGYRDALNDVMLLLASGGVMPDRRDYWK